MTVATLLPTVEGLVHGIVSVSPPTIQCDGCGKRHSGEKMAMTVLTSNIVFNIMAEATQHDRRRMCDKCWEGAGWVNRGMKWVRTK